MNALKGIIAGAAAAAIVLSFRDFENGGWLPAGGRGATLLFGDDEEEPVLGYDGMDRDTVIEWLREAELDEETLFRVHEYETTHRRREPVLAALDALM